MSWHAGHAPRVSVAIVNWNTRELLAACLASLEGERRRGLCEVVVVDNGSSDGSAEMVAERFADVHLIRNAANLGFTRATNQACAAARAPHVLLLNSDTVVEPGALDHCADFLDAHPDVGAVGCRLTFPDGRPQSSCFRFPSVGSVVLKSLYLSQLFPRSALLNRDRYGEESWSEPHPVDCVMGSFLMIRRAAVPSWPLLDEGYFMYGEEADLCFRLRRAGWKTVYFPFATVVHHHGGSSTSPRIAARVYEAKQRAILRFLWKWRGTPVAWFANAVMAVSLIPRTVGWAVADLARSMTARRWCGAVRSRRARALRFHVAACLRPSLFESSWDWTREVRPDHPSGT